MEYCIAQKMLKRCSALSLALMWAVLPIIAKAEEQRCIVDDARPSNGEILDAQTLLTIKSEPLLIDLDEGTILHPVWATENFDGYQLADHNVPEGQAIILGFVENGIDPSNGLPVLDVGFMMNIEKESNGQRAFLIATETPSEMFAEGRCNRID